MNTNTILSRYAPLFIACLIVAPAPAAEEVVVFVFDQTLDAVFRLHDRNHDGDMLDPNEVTRFFDDTVGGGLGLDNSQGLYALGPWALLATDNFAPDNVVLMVDLNHDGDAFDAGEALEWFNGALPGGYHLTNPVTLSLGHDGAFYLIDNNTLDTANPEAVYRLEDINDDGDVNDAGEVTLYFELSPPGASLTTTFDIEFDSAGAGYVFDITDPDQIESIDRISPDASSIAEWIDSADLYWNFGLVFSGGNELTVNVDTDEIVAVAVAGNWTAYIIALNDRDSSGYIDDGRELRVLWSEVDNADGVTSGLPRDLFYAWDGSLVFADNGEDQVVRLVHQNADFDYLDANESRVIYNADLVGDTGLPEMRNLLSVAAAPTPLAGDCDADEDVDASDVDNCVGCLAGPGNGLGTGCICSDDDFDGDVDVVDFAAVQAAYTG